MCDSSDMAPACCLLSACARVERGVEEGAALRTVLCSQTSSLTAFTPGARLRRPGVLRPGRDARRSLPAPGRTLLPGAPVRARAPPGRVSEHRVGYGDTHGVARSSATGSGQRQRQGVAFWLDICRWRHCELARPSLRVCMLMDPARAPPQHALSSMFARSLKLPEREPARARPNTPATRLRRDGAHGAPARAQVRPAALLLHVLLRGRPQVLRRGRRRRAVPPLGLPRRADTGRCAAPLAGGARPGAPDALA